MYPSCPCVCQKAFAHLHSFSISAGQHILFYFPWEGTWCRWRSICHVKVRWWRCSSIKRFMADLPSWVGQIQFPLPNCLPWTYISYLMEGLFFKSHKLWSPRLTSSVLVHDPPCSSASWRQQHCWNELKSSQIEENGCTESHELCIIFRKCSQGLKSGKKLLRLESQIYYQGPQQDGCTE